MHEIFTQEGIPLEREFNECLAEVHKARVAAENLSFHVVDTPIAPPDAKVRGYRLYQITELLQQCNAIAEIDAEANEGVINDDLAAQLDALELAKEQKVLAICKLIRNLESRDAAFDEPIKRMKARQTAVQRDIKRLKDYLGLHVTEGECFEDPEIKLSWRAPSGTEIIDETLIPDEYCKFSLEISYSKEEKETIDLMKDKAKKNPYSKFVRTPELANKIIPALKKEKEVPGVKLKDKKTIQIK